MAYSNTNGYGMHDALSQDITCELTTGDAPGNLSVSLIDGRYQFDFDYTASGAARVRGVDTGSAGIVVVSGVIRTNQAPSAAISIWSRQGGPTRGHIQEGIDRKLRIYGRDGIQYGSASTTLIPTADPGQEFHVVFDGLTLSTVHVKVYFGGTEELAFDTGISWSAFFQVGTPFNVWWGDDNVPGGGLGAHLYGYNLITRKSTTAGDAPHLLDYPRLLAVGSLDTPPAAAGTYTNWTDQGSCTNYECVDDTAGHDGDTTFLEEFDKGMKHTLEYTAANPIPASPTPTVEFIQLRDVGKYTADKFGAHFMVRLGTSESIQSGTGRATAGSSYVGGRWIDIPRPGGGSWSRNDADPGDVEFGWESEDTPDDTGAQITLQPGPTWVYHTATLPLGTTPTLAVTRPLVNPNTRLKALVNGGLVT